MLEVTAKTKVPQYTGTLTPEMLSRGCNLARENAMRLARDARILYESARYPTAITLAILSIEESGKVHILDCLALIDNNAEAAREWKKYRKHTAKNIFWSFTKSPGKSLREAVDDIFSHPERPIILEQIKQNSLYTDCLEPGRWITPNQIPEKIARPLAEALIEVAERNAQGARTEREMQLWIQNVKPFMKDSKEAMDHAIAAHFEMLQREGLMSPDIEVDDLIFGQIDDEDELRSKDSTEYSDEHAAEIVR